MINEKITDLLIDRLLRDAHIQATPNGSSLTTIQNALETASKNKQGNRGYPEFVAQVQDFILVIENKADIAQQAHYDDETQTILSETPKATKNYAENGALHYARHIAAGTSFQKIFAFGCTGNEKHHTIRPIFVDANGYQLLEKVENFSNFNADNIENYYRQQVLGETAPEQLELEDILKKAKELHEHLQNYGQLGTAEKPLVVSGILLALSEPTFQIDHLMGDHINPDGERLYGAIAAYMSRVQVTPATKKARVLSQFSIIQERTLLNQKDVRLGKTPLRFFTEYLEKNILRSIKANSSEDILGRFYGEFISYSGGDGQSLGVILTPRHITDLFCELAQVQPHDRIFDPCCGTSGFLIAAMHAMLKQTPDEALKESIKKEQIFGVEIREDMFSIATTNMILRGDGKSNLENNDFFKMSAAHWREKKCNVGFINPPYSQAKNKETAHLSEIRFIEHLLDCLHDKARCIAIVPQSTMVGKTAEDRKVKKRILKQHTLEGVITLNKNTFYGIGTNACIAVFTAHQPHPKEKRSKFINFEDDGYVVKKHIGLVATQRAIEKKRALLDWWRDHQDAESRHLIKTTIEADDEWLHSFYYFNDEIPKEADFERTINDYLTFEFSMIMQGREYLFENDAPARDIKKKVLDAPQDNFLKAREWHEFVIGEVFDVSGTTTTQPCDLIKKGNTPRITCAASNNGLDNFYKNQATEKSGVLTADSATTGFVSYQGYEFIATDHVEKLSLKNGKLISRNLGIFLKSIIEKSIHGKYGYGYKFSQARIKKQKILLPVNQKGEPDYEYMEAYARSIENQKLEKYRNWIQQRLTNLHPPPGNDNRSQCRSVAGVQNQRHFSRYTARQTAKKRGTHQRCNTLYFLDCF